MAYDQSQLSTTDATNDVTGFFKTGMRPSAVKNAGWRLAAILAQLFNAKITASGTNTITLTNPIPFASITSGLEFIFWPAGPNTGPVTITADSQTQYNLFANGAALAGGELQSNTPARCKFDGTQYVLLNPAQPGRNAFVDPCCRVAQIGTGGTIPTLATSYKYGVVDLVQCKATGTAVSAGTITQDTTGVIASASTPYSCKIAGATITGTGKVFFRKWCESRDALAFINGYGIFGVWFRHDVGSNINAFLTANAFQSQDSAGTPVQIATNSGSPTSVTTGTDTLILLAVPNMSVAGTVANGFELILEADCGAVTTKNFYATDWQGCLKTLAQKCVVPLFADDLAAAIRYFESSYEYGTAPGTITNNGMGESSYGQSITNASIAFIQRFLGKKVVTPAVTIYSPNSGTSARIFNATAAGDAVVSATPDTATAQVTKSSTTVNAGDRLRWHFTADARL